MDTFNIGESHKHIDRIRSLKLTLSLSVAPMYLLFKDHKGWSLETGTPPPSRPVVSAGAGQNYHMSEIISTILEPIVKNWKGSMEMESTGDLVSIVNDISEKKVVVEEEVDLELVDEHMMEKERQINERYNNFDQNIPNRWPWWPSIIQRQN